MQNRNHQGEGQQGGHQGANSAGNKNQLAGSPDNLKPDSSYERENSQREQPGDPNFNVNRNSDVNRDSDVNRSHLAQKFGQTHGLNQQQSTDAADSFLGSVNWASHQNRDDDFRDFVNPQTLSSTNALYSNWQKEFNSRLRKNGFEENQAKKLSSEAPDSYFQELSNAGSDENWYRNFGNHGRDVSGDGSSNESRSSNSSTSGSSRDSS